MFNEATFWELHLPSSGNLNDYVVRINSKYADLDKSNRICRPG